VAGGNNRSLRPRACVAGGNLRSPRRCAPRDDPLSHCERSVAISDRHVAALLAMTVNKTHLAMTEKRVIATASLRGGWQSQVIATASLRGGWQSQSLRPRACVAGGNLRRRQRSTRQAHYRVRLGVYHPNLPRRKRGRFC